MKEIKNIIWDWNGTIMNDIQLCADIACQIISKHSHEEISLEKYRNEFGFPIADFYRRMGVDFSIEPYEDLTLTFIKEYESRVAEIKLHDGIRDVLEYFQEKQKSQNILTAAHSDMVFPKLDQFGIRTFFDQIEGLDNHNAVSKIGRGIELVNRMGFEKEKTIMIGDTDHDYHVAEALDIQCILVARGHQSKERLQQIDGKFTLLDSINDVPLLFH